MIEAMAGTITAYLVSPRILRMISYNTQTTDGRYVKRPRQESNLPPRD